MTPGAVTADGAPASSPMEVKCLCSAPASGRRPTARKAGPAPARATVMHLTVNPPDDHARSQRHSRPSTRIADYALVNPHDAEVSESVQITQFRTVGSAGTSPTGMSCRGEQAGGAHGTLVLLSRETELEIVRGNRHPWRPRIRYRVGE